MASPFSAALMQSGLQPVFSAVANVQRCSGVLYTIRATSTRVSAAVLLQEMLAPNGRAVDYGVFVPVFVAYAKAMGYPTATAATGWVNFTSVQLDNLVPPHNWICPLDYPAGAQPNGFGAWCYSDSIACMEGPNSCTNSAPCALDLTTCSTGMAGNLRAIAGEGSNFAHFCELDTPIGSVPNGGGTVCYDTALHCSYGPNNWCVIFLFILI